MKQDLANLTKFKETHRNCKHEESKEDHDIITKEGKGADCVCDDRSKCQASSPQSDNSVCQKDTSFNENLNFILPNEAPSVDVSKTKSDSEKEKVPIPIELCLSKLWKKYTHKARKLLEELDNSSRFSVDKLSMVSIDELPLHISIFNLIKQCYKSKSHVGTNLDPFVDLIKELKLENYITNKYMLMKDDLNILNTPYWYFIG